MLPSEITKYLPELYIKISKCLRGYYNLSINK